MPQRVLLTGANGFVGSQILVQLLSDPSGPLVRAVVRSQAKADRVRADFANTNIARLSFAIVPDITASGAFNHAFDTSPTEPPFDAVIHTASPFLYKAIKSNIEWLDPAVKGTTEILKAAKSFASSVKRVVITSSFAAVFSEATHQNDGKVYTADDWSPLTWEEVLNGEPSVGYRGSKKFAEKAAWDFVEAEKPQFSITVLNPPMVYGPLAHTIESVKDLNESNSRIYNLFVNSKKDAALPPDGVHAYADVRDIARAQVAAASSASAANKRLLLAKSQVSSQQISDILRAKFPEVEDRVPVGKPGTSSLPEGAWNVDTKTGWEVLGLTELKTMEETFGDLGAQLLAIEKAERKEQV